MRLHVVRMILLTELARLDIFDGRGEVLRTDWLIGEPTKGWQ